jgi:Neuraminidase (sialidase)
MPVGISVALEYSNDAGATWTYTPVTGGCSAPAGFDGCVNRVRWRLLSSLSSTGPDNTGNVQFVARIK